MPWSLCVLRVEDPSSARPASAAGGRSECRGMAVADGARCTGTRFSIPSDEPIAIDQFVLNRHLHCLGDWP